MVTGTRLLKMGVLIGKALRTGARLRRDERRVQRPAGQSATMKTLALAAEGRGTGGWGRGTDVPPLTSPGCGEGGGMEPQNWNGETAWSVPVGSPENSRRLPKINLWITTDATSCNVSCEK